MTSSQLHPPPQVLQSPLFAVLYEFFYSHSTVACRRTFSVFRHKTYLSGGARARTVLSDSERGGRAGVVIGIRPDFGVVGHPITEAGREIKRAVGAVGRIVVGGHATWREIQQLVPGGGRLLRPPSSGGSLAPEMVSAPPHIQQLQLFTRTRWFQENVLEVFSRLHIVQRLPTWSRWTLRRLRQHVLTSNVLSEHTASNIADESCNVESWSE